MATLETQKLDSIIASRRAMLIGGGALAALAVAGTGTAKAAVPTTPNDTQILNFALNLEYLEANYYTLATEGVTADKAQTSPVGITASSTSGTPAVTTVTPGGAVKVKANSAVNFTSQAIAAYAFETAREERNHVNFLRSALGNAAVAQPVLDLQTSFVGLGNLLTPAVANFDPFANDMSFLLGSFIFEDVGVTAYHGGAAYLSKATLTPAVQIHAVEAYHAGLVRVSILALDLQNGYAVGTGPGAMTATSIANLRAAVDGTKGKLPDAADAVGLTGQDDFGLFTIQVPLNGTPQTATTILDTGKVTAAGSSTTTFNNYVAFARTLQQVLAIVYASPAGKPGGFFPNGLNGDIS